ncbi:MAG: hypothetical protein U5N56_08580 [Candidatus Marinimicrobia bacterium]|nr:hypothetical protein [Candidatus Neomarinimicrobiota bacterium]
MGKFGCSLRMPGWFDTSNLTRGFAYGNIGGNDRLIVVSRDGGNNLFVLDAATGDSLSVLDASGITGGTYHISDAAVSADGDIYVCNLALNTTLKVYKWDAVDASPSVVIEHPYTSGRVGDKMSAYGSSADNSLTLLFGDAANDQVLRFTTADNGATFDPDTILIDQHGGSASAALTDDGALYHNASGVYLKRYDGGVSTQVSGGVCGTGTNAIEFLFNDGKSEYAATFQYGGGNENARILKVPDGDLTAASTYALTPTLGSNSNANGAGDVAVKDNGDGTYTVYVLSCNNGLGAYTFEFPVPPVDPVNMTNVMEVWGGDYGFFAASGDASRGMGYNPVTDHILVASRAGGAYVHVLDAQTGAGARYAGYDRCYRWFLRYLSHESGC